MTEQPTYTCSNCGQHIEFTHDIWVHVGSGAYCENQKTGAQPDGKSRRLWKMWRNSQYGKSTPVDKAVHNHGLADMTRREGMWGVIWIAFCECGIAFASVDIHGALKDFDRHANNPADDEQLLEAHRARVAYSTRGDFTMLELFPYIVKATQRDMCHECGVNIIETDARQVHLAWHNKLLP